VQLYLISNIHRQYIFHHNITKETIFLAVASCPVFFYLLTSDSNHLLDAKRCLAVGNLFGQTLYLDIRFFQHVPRVEIRERVCHIETVTWFTATDEIAVYWMCSTFYEHLLDYGFRQYGPAFVVDKRVSQMFCPALAKGLFF